MFSSRIVNVANMYFDAIHENKKTAIFFEFTVFLEDMFPYYFSTSGW